jgi:hypothetical protein
VDSSHWAELLLSGKALPGPVVARIANLPAVPLYAFAQDLYAGSGFELSKFESQEPDEAGQAQIKKILGRKQVFFFWPSADAKDPQPQTGVFWHLHRPISKSLLTSVQ